MATADEIKSRVRRAEEARIERRADAAAGVAAAHQEVERLRTELADAQRTLASRVATTEKEMTRQELASFLGVKQSEVSSWASAAPKRRAQRRTRSNGSSTDPERPAAAQPQQTTDAESADSSLAAE